MSKFLFLLFFFEFQAGACNCDKIKRQGYCYNPSCIELCNLGSFFDNINESLVPQCLLTRERKLQFTQDKKVGVLGLQSFLTNIEDNIKKIEKEDNETLKKKCPHCSLFPEVKIHLKTTPKSKTCPEEYMKEHNYLQAYKIRMTNSKCNKTKLKKELQNLGQKILREKNEQGKALWKACPDPCSFDTTFYTRINEGDCTGSISMKVLCTHPRKPKYRVSVEYNRGMQCKK